MAWSAREEQSIHKKIHIEYLARFCAFMLEAINFVGNIIAY